uniref:Uncharacterized protein n=1 Tax=Grammatophora oceanica TaxID=210454 RepID=A0A7S1UQT3_9STRA|mmetsp:Transcript_14077/g.20614  ORF Transcript_14077/g.20614 Transcript_14077/m.20614 type:complete len:141 (+) Transcript_14077:79-501(+)|eukprot:CAMPEP_0194047718 /NCGR_PEP_ID=MMETSP0009_2-20130614/25233_1 /TAXON_ID=210454 /ORGANISM="Grammatophora oceanica, Strain CCMP 410" /LENGTH=140 /DNA_ID=CAMNT_0038693405 /DNA_START=44 /DNA_END=466 /DNA_ORIENTATION=+
MIIESSSALAALMAFCALTLLHVSIVIIHRNILIITGKRKPTEFGKTRDEEENSFIGRVSNSHYNCLESLPLLTAVVLINYVVDGAPDISDKAWFYVAARAGQALSHWASVGMLGVTGRFLCFAISHGLLITMGYQTMMG